MESLTYGADVRLEGLSYGADVRLESLTYGSGTMMGYLPMLEADGRNCQTSAFVGGPLFVVRCEADPIAAPRAPNEPTADSENAPNEPTVHIENAPNEPTAHRSEATKNLATKAGRSDGAQFLRNEPNRILKSCWFRSNTPNNGTEPSVPDPASGPGQSHHSAFLPDLGLHEICANEPTVHFENAPNEPTVHIENAPNEPTAGVGGFVPRPGRAVRPGRIDVRHRQVSGNWQLYRIDLVRFTLKTTRDDEMGADGVGR